MSIKIPGKGPGGAPGIGTPGSDEAGATRSKAPVGDGFAEKLGGTGGPGGPGGPKGADAIAAIAAELKAGQLTPRQAVDKLLDLTLDKGAAARLPEQVKAKLRADLETLLTGDPVLASKAKRLGLELPGEGEGED